MMSIYIFVFPNIKVFKFFRFNRVFHQMSAGLTAGPPAGKTKRLPAHFNLRRSAGDQASHQQIKQTRRSNPGKRIRFQHGSALEKQQPASLTLTVLRGAGKYLAVSTGRLQYLNMFPALFSPNSDAFPLRSHPYFLLLIRPLKQLTPSMKASTTILPAGIWVRS
ncbi:hypothetical protein SAMN04487894_12912 [Niabella drilacis]|uniref:Uncharacterized protein n=1 Tax=Niabella drilacis (strain DSM 25811 / CCM 8410 / CCUG 62505 / LMG 26954 / E90) TaxID=1285928 RepID=A0A1G7BFM0_NIADE|nr:hypothetical protein SAMN04487894_12912 [Niabella drilacis]